MDEPNKASWRCCNTKPARCWPCAIKSAAMPSRVVQLPTTLQAHWFVAMSTNMPRASLTDAVRAACIGPSQSPKP
ncbi:hypothetical protein, partial [Xanthomonas citri]